MKNDQGGLRALLILGACGFAVVSYLGLLHLSGCRAEIGESNFQTNLIKLQNLEGVSDPSLVLAGSSLTGRLLESYFEGDRVVNLGLDGCNTAFALSQLLQAGPVPEFVLMEANSILTRRLENEKSLTEARQRFEFELSGPIPTFRAENRPSSILYDRLKKGKSATGSKNEPPAGIPIERGSAASDSLTPDEQAIADRLVGLVEELKKRGARCVWVMLPDNRFDQVPRAREYAVMRSVGAVAGVEIFDLKRWLPGDKMTYTDGLHLAPGSAREIVRLMEAALVSMDPEGRF